MVKDSNIARDERFAAFDVSAINSWQSANPRLAIELTGTEAFSRVICFTRRSGERTVFVTVKAILKFVRFLSRVSRFLAAVQDETTIHKLLVSFLRY